MQLSLKTSSFFKRIFSNLALYIWFGIFLFSLVFLFNFQGVADFRDTRFLLKPENFDFVSNFYNVQYWVHRVFYVWIRFDFSIPLFWNIFYSLIFSLGWVFSFIFLKKIVEKIFLKQKGLEQKKVYPVLNLTYFLSAGIYIFNPYTLERFFMGHYYVLLGHSIFILCLYFVLKWFKNRLEAKNTGSNIDFLNFSLDFKKLFSKDFWYLLLVMIFSQSVNTHHGVFLLYFLAVCVTILLILSLFKNFSKNPKQAILKNFFNYINLQFLLASGASLLLFLATYIFRDGFRNVNFYLENIAGSQNKFQIIRSFSLQTLTDSFTEHIMKASLGLGNWMSPMVEIQGIRQSLGFLVGFTLQYSFFLQFLIFVVLIFFLSRLLVLILSEKEFRNNPVLILIFSSLILTWVLNFGYSHPFFVRFNQLFYNFIPGFYTFREPGKFYSFFLAFLTVLIAFWTTVKFSQTNENSLKSSLINLFLILLLISNLTPFLLISRHLNYVEYPAIFKTVEQFCKENPNQKFIFLPIEIYLVASYSPRVFTASPSGFYFKKCRFLRFDKMSVQDGRTGEVFSLKTTQKSQKLDLIIAGLKSEESGHQDFRENLEGFLKENQVNNILIETYNNPENQLINQVLQNEYRLKEQENDIFWYKIQN